MDQDDNKEDAPKSVPEEKLDIADKKLFEESEESAKRKKGSADGDVDSKKLSAGDDKVDYESLKAKEDLVLSPGKSSLGNNADAQLQQADSDQRKIENAQASPQPFISSLKSGGHVLSPVRLNDNIEPSEVVVERLRDSEINNIGALRSSENVGLPLNYSEATGSMVSSKKFSSMVKKDQETFISDKFAFDDEMKLSGQQQPLLEIHEEEHSVVSSKKTDVSGVSTQTESGGKNESRTLFEGQCPYDKTWWIQRCFFSWIVPLVTFARKEGRLKQDNFGKISPKIGIDVQTKKLSKVWDRKRQGKVGKNTLFWTIASCYKWNFLYLMYGNVVSSLLNITQPLFVSALINYIKNGDNTLKEYNFHFINFQGMKYLDWFTEDRQYGLSLSIVMLALQLLRYVNDENFRYAELMLGTYSQAALQKLIYEKQLNVYPATIAEFSSGELVNFVQTDSLKLFDYVSCIGWMLNVPVLLAGCFGFLFYHLGVTFFAGIGVFIISFVVNAWMSKLTASYYEDYMKEQDERVSLTTESLNNIKMLKLYSWTSIFEKFIKDKRKKEMRWLKKMFYLDSFIIGAVYFFPILLQCVAFTVYIGCGNTMDLSLAYSCITIFNIMIDPIIGLPYMLGCMIQFIVSMQRIQKFLLADEINQTIVEHVPKKEGDKNDANQEGNLLLADPMDKEEHYQSSFQINGASNFYWGIQKDKEDEDAGEQEEDKPKKSKEEQHKEILDQRDSAKNDQNKGKKVGESDPSQPLLIDSGNKEKDEENKEEDEENKKENKKKVTVNDLLALQNLDLNVKKGEFVCIIGDVGSGKSSLLSTLINDLQYIDSSFKSEVKDKLSTDEEVQKQLRDHSQQPVKIEQKRPIKIFEDIAYVQQTPWIQNKTIKENILFGKKFDRELYNKTIKICQLSRDMEILPGGDETEIGEKGINLSGGQKARISLARAVYQDKDLILMDDPISALDANVKKKIFEEVFEQEFRNKTRVLVTHAVDFLSLVDRIILMKEGQIILQGSYEELKDNDYLIQLKNIHQSHQKEKEDVQRKADEDLEASQISQQQILHNSKHENSKISNKSKSKNLLDKSKGKVNNKITTDEDDEIIQVGFEAYKKFFMGYYGGFKFIIAATIMQGMYQVTMFCNQYLIGHWAQSDDQIGLFRTYALLAYGFTITTGLGAFGRAQVMQMFSWWATKKLHEDMIHYVLRAPINLYFDTTPVGRIMNKFSADLNEIEGGFQYQIGSMFMLTFNIIYSVIVAVAVIPWLALLFPVIAFVSYWIVSRAGRGIQETVRLQSTIKSPLLSFLGESISGQSTIRAFKKNREFIEQNDRILNQNILAQQMQNAVQCWFALKVDLFAFFLMLTLILVCVIVRENADHIMLSIVVTQVLTIQDTLIWALKTYMYVETDMVKSDRCMKLMEIPQENLKWGHGVDLIMKQRPNWPEEGYMEFKNVSLKYRPTTEIVLNRLSFKIQKGEKIGVVGRTGAGKSTICLAISRIVEIFEGSILIDGLDISQVQIETLRSRITLIPQDPTMFTGTLRFNLDPEEKATDEEILALLKEGQLQSLIDNNPKGLNQEITENGSNLSSGERQLLCICRAILRNSKLVILDEATANIDVVTEQNIQNLINSKFKDATMVVIAHRINTIIQSDRVLVLSFGQIKEFDAPSKLMSNPMSEFSQLIQELKKKEQE